MANALVPILLDADEPVRLVSRRGYAVPGAEAVKADLTDGQATMDAVRGSSTVYLLAGLAYDIRAWRDQWPKIMASVIAACREASARLIFFDNVYMYGIVDGPMTEETPFNPSSRKGEVRAQIARRLLDEMAAGNVNALIARSADFYGPAIGATSVPNLLVFSNLARGKKAQWMGSADAAHSFTFIPDAARGLYALARRDDAFGQSWHLPTAAPPLTGREFVARAAAAMGGPDGVALLPNWLLTVGGLFNRTIKETGEMVYQYDRPYLFDSGKFDRAFGSMATPYDDGIRITAEHYRPRA